MSDYDDFWTVLIATALAIIFRIFAPVPPNCHSNLPQQFFTTRLAGLCCSNLRVYPQIATAIFYPVRPVPRLGSARRGWVRRGTVRLSSVRFGSAAAAKAEGCESHPKKGCETHSVPLDSGSALHSPAQLSSAWLRLAWLGSARCDPAQLCSVRPGSANSEELQRLKKMS